MLVAKYAFGELCPPLVMSCRVEKEPVARESQGDMSLGEASKEGLVSRLVGVQLGDAARVDVTLRERRVRREESMVFVCRDGSG